MRLIEHFFQNISPKQILLVVVCLPQIAYGCYHNCCCTNGESQITCDSTDLLPLPPFPEDKSKWCGGYRGSLPNGSDIKDIRLTHTKADRIDKAGLLKYPCVQNLSIAYSRFQTLEARAFSIPDTTSCIEEVDAIYNVISHLDERAFEGLPKLKRLRLTGNRIRKVPTNVFLETRSIQEIWLNENQIREFDPSIFSGLYSLDKIELSSNLIEALQVFPKLAVTSLRLGNNSLKTLQSDVFSNLRLLEILDLSKNKLTSMPGDLFSRNFHLRHLNLNNNTLKSIGKETFSHLCYLRSLDLRHNQLKIIHVEWFASVAYNSDEKTDGATYGSGQAIEDYPVNDGNPWSCEADDRNFLEYEFFLIKVCEQPQLKMIKLPQYLNLKCEKSGRMLIDVAGCGVSLSKELQEKDRHMILAQNNNSRACNNSNIPPCHFLSSRCAGTDESPLPPPPQVQGPKMLVIYAGVAIVLTVSLAFVAYRVVRNHKEKRRRHSSESSSGSSTSDSYYPSTPILERDPEIPSRRDPDGNSQCTSSAQSEESEDTQSIDNPDSITTPKEPHSPGLPRSNSLTIPKTLLGAGNQAETVPKEPVLAGETVPKEHDQSREILPTDHLHLPALTASERPENIYVNTPKRDPNANSEYTPMSPLLHPPPPPPPPIPPRTYRENRTDMQGVNMQGVIAFTHPLPILEAQPTSQCPSSHCYCSIINPDLGRERPPIPTPQYCLNPDCYLRYPPNPVLLPHVVYRERRPTFSRPRSDQQPLLEDGVTDTSSGDICEKEEKAKKQKKKKKGGKK